MNIIVLGPPGSGKGTQADFLAEKFSLEHIDMGKTLREVAKMDTPLGREIYEIQNVTKTLVPSRILREVLHLKLGSIPREQGIVFDGVPRTFDQMQYIDESMNEFGRRLSQVFWIKISEDEAVERISKRWVCEKCKAVFIMGQDIQSPDDVCPHCEARISQRIDDTTNGVKKRFQVFETETLPVLEEYRRKNILTEIDGKKSKEEVFEEILKNL